MAHVRSPILIGDNKRKYSSHQPWIHGTSLMWAPHVWCCVTDFSSLTALLEYLITCKIRAQSPSPDGRYQIICNFVRTSYEPLDYTNLIFDRCVATRLCQQTRFIVPEESAGAHRVPHKCRKTPDRTDTVIIVTHAKYYAKYTLHYRYQTKKIEIGLFLVGSS